MDVLSPLTSPSTSRFRSRFLTFRLGPLLGPDMDLKVPGSPGCGGTTPPAPARRPQAGCATLLGLFLHQQNDDLRQNHLQHSMSQGVSQNKLRPRRVPCTEQSGPYNECYIKANRGTTQGWGHPGPRLSSQHESPRLQSHSTGEDWKAIQCLPSPTAAQENCLWPQTHSSSSQRARHLQHAGKQNATQRGSSPWCYPRCLSCKHARVGPPTPDCRVLTSPLICERPGRPWKITEA